MLRGGALLLRVRPALLAAPPARALRACSSSAAPESRTSRFKTLVRKYGPIAVVFHLSVYGTTLMGFYKAVEWKLVSAGDAVDMARWVGLDRFMDLEKVNPSAGNLAVAWVLAKFTEPVRWILTAMCTPRIARLAPRWLRRR